MYHTFEVYRSCIPPEMFCGCLPPLLAPPDSCASWDGLWYLPSIFQIPDALTSMGTQRIWSFRVPRAPVPTGDPYAARHREIQGHRRPFLMILGYQALPYWLVEKACEPLINEYLLTVLVPSRSSFSFVPGTCTPQQPVVAFPLHFWIWRGLVQVPGESMFLLFFISAR